MADFRSNSSTYLEIHLDRVRRNYLFLKKKLSRGTDIAAVVKADSYGIGAAEVSLELHKAGCRHFYVSSFDEGMDVRAALKGGESDIYALHGPSGAPPEEFLNNQLTPVLNSFGDIEYWSSFSRKTGKKQPAVIHIDTGMNRLGLPAAEVERLKNNVDILKPLDIRYVMSHLACADDPSHPKNKEQLEKFNRLTACLGMPSRLSFANSSGIFLGEDYFFDQVRPGCALYGINPQPSLPNPVSGVVTLKARILQTRDVDRGETVGYASSYMVSFPSKLATISAGYADGILRSFENGGAVYIGEKKCPVVGRVSMDAIVADVTGTPCEAGSTCVAGGWAEIIGEHQTVDDVAAGAKTIGYEILTGLGKRYKRIYSGRE